MLDARARRHARRASPRSPTTAPRCRSTSRRARSTREITTRDIDRGDVPALPAEGDLRGAGVVPQDAARQARRARRRASTCALGAETLPADAARARCATGAIRRVVVIGQGTAAVAGQSLAARARRALRRRPRCASRPSLATELSGFGLRDDMSDTLVVAISQSGTTTDTNRTVDLVRARGARGGRDREPAQQRPRRQGRRRALHVRRPRRRDERAVDQGVLRADRRRLPARARASPTSSATLDADAAARAARRRCARCPTRWTQVLDAARRRSPAIAQRHAPSRRYWAVVGNGAQPHRRRRGADQALRALLQVDRVRRHRGQEAHRPVVRAADPRVRGRAHGLERRRRRPRRSRSTARTRPRRS